MRLILFCTLAVACKDGGPADDSASDSEGSEFHPNVPPGYEYKWDTDGCGDDGTDTQIYTLAEGSSDADGNFTMTETWYWFFGGDWEDDCIDVIQYSGDRVSPAVLEQLSASEAEEGYEALMTKAEDGCPMMNYLYLWDHRDKEDFEYGDTLEQDTFIVFDNLSPSGNLNVDNAMLVFMYYDTGGGRYSGDTDYARGVFLPDTEVLAPPAHYTWEASMCLSGGGS